MSTTHHFTAADGTTLAYRDEGEGPALLLLPGLTRDGRDFDYLMPHLPPGLRVIRPDYRGRGASGHADPSTYTVPQEAADVRALLDHLGIARAAIIGTSRGGLIAMFLAATTPERVAGVLLNDVGPVLERRGLERIFDYVGRNPAARTHAEMARLLARTMPEAGFEGVPLSRWEKEARRHWRETDQGLQITYDPRLREAFLAAFEGPEPDLWPLFEALAGRPAGLIRGANSDLLSPEAAAEMRRRLPGMIHAEVPGRGHIPFLDEPEALAAVHAFLDAVRSAEERT